MSTSLHAILKNAVEAHQAGRLKEAQAAYLRILEADDRQADAWHLLGVLDMQCGRHADAIERISRAIELEPRRWQFHGSLGDALQVTQGVEQAVASYRRAIQVAPSQASLHCNLGTIYHQNGQLDEARGAYQLAISLDPNLADAHYNLANLHREQGRVEEAAASYERALESNTRHGKARMSLGTLCLEQGRAEEALLAYQRVMEDAPDRPDVHYHMGLAHRSLGNLDRALACYQRAIDLKSDYAEAHFALGLLLLEQGDDPQGWAEYEWRWRRAANAALIDARVPWWDGRPIRGKRLLVSGEQRIDEEILFASWLPELRNRIEGEVLLECDPLLVTLYRRSFPWASIDAREGWEPATRWGTGRAVDVQIPLAGLPRRLRGGQNNERAAYLLPDAEGRRRWRERLALLPGGLKVGLAWTLGGNERPGAQSDNNLDDWAGLLDHPSICWVALQSCGASQARAALADQYGINIHCFDDHHLAHDLDDLATLISALDAVLVAPGTAAHLAGGLGTKGLVLLPRAADWYWLRDRRDCSWYPSLRLIRCETSSWQHAVAEARTELTRMLKLGAWPEPRASSKAAGKTINPGSPNRVVARPALEITAEIRQAFHEAADLDRAGNHAAAEERYRWVLQREPRHAAAAHGLGVLALRSKRMDMALEYLRKAVDHDPTTPVYLFHLAVALSDSNQPEESSTYLRRVLNLLPNCGEAHMNLGAVLERLGRHDEALSYCQRAVELLPESAASYYNLGNVQLHLGHLDQALATYDRCLSVEPDHAKGHWNRGMTLLLMRRFREGWEEWEWRERADEVRIDHFDLPVWDGSSLTNKTLLIHAEQGVGDEIMFASCVGDLVTRARHVVVACEPRLESLFRRSFPKASVYGVRRGGKQPSWNPPSGIDLTISAGSVPRYLRPTVESFPRHERFLAAEPAAVTAWRRRYDQLGPGLKVGVSWRAGGKATEQRRRTAMLDLWQPVFNVPGVQLINLQYGDSTADLELVRQRSGVTIHDWDDADPVKDLDGFAAQIAALDLVLSIGNTTVHMAGGLGVPTWTLLPQVPGWRYMIEGDELLWYQSVKLFRQKRRDDWGALLADMADRLAALAGERNERAGGVIPRGKTHAPGETSDSRSGSSTITSDRPISQRCEDTQIASRSAVPEVADAAQTSRTIRQAATFESAVAPKSSKTVRDILHEGMKQHRAGALGAAEALYREVLAASPDDTDAAQLLGLIATQTGRPQMAVDLMRQSLAGREAQPIVHYNLASALMSLGRVQEAIDHYRRVIQLDSQFAEAHLNLGACWFHQGELEKALECYHRALNARPDYAEAHHNIGSVLVRQARIEQAIERFQVAVDKCPSYYDAQVHLGEALLSQGRLDQALAAFDRAIALRPQEAEIHGLRATVLLKMGQLRTGWNEWEWRWQSRFAPRRGSLRLPQWTGGPLAGKRVVVHAEGLLDQQILFGTCLAEMASQATELVIECDPRLAPLMRRALPSTVVVPQSDDERALCEAAADANLQVWSGSLPGILRTDWSQFPNRPGYLLADPHRRMEWQQRLAHLGSGLKIGIVWRGSGHPAEHRRDCSALESWEPILRIPGACILSLQPGDCAHELEAMRRKKGIAIHAYEGIASGSNLDELAAFITALDVVIAVDGITVHLAGALGVETCMLASLGSHWCWHAERSDCPWYPTLRIFRQSMPGQWDNVLDGVARSLSARRGPGHWLPRPHISRNHPDAAFDQSLGMLR